jgi:Bax protein
MRYIVLFISIFLSAQVVHQPLYTVANVPKNMSVSTKKARFYYLIVPVVQKVHKELKLKHDSVLKDMKNSQNRKQIQELKKVYRITTDKELLLALKPHPQSIVLAQAAMESAWATSRFFVQANNIFGIWSTNKFQKRIAAKEKRDGIRTIWLRKFDTLEDSVREYYKMIATAKVYKEFRALRYSSNDVIQMVKKLDKYSEIGERYTKELASMIRYNKLTKYDK